MSEVILSDYFYGDESEQFIYFRIPRLLITSPRFKHLSTDAKLLYGMLLDRMSLSAKNNWYDEDGRVYIYYTVEEICGDMNCGRDKAMKLLAELDTGKGVGLIERIKQGQGKPTKIYVKRFTTRAVPPPAPPESDPFMPIPEVDFSDVQKSEKPTSRGRKSRLAEVEKSDPNHTNRSHPDFSHPDPSISPRYPPYGEMDGIDRNQIREELKENIDYEHLRSQCPYDDVESLLELMVDVVSSTASTIRIGGEVLPLGPVKERFRQLDSSHIEYVIDSLKQTTTKINNIRAYLSINGAVKKQDYTYFMYKGNDGVTREVPAYCVNPYIKGVPQKVEPGQSIKYLAKERSSDPKVVGIISNGYPHRSLGELKLDNKYQAYYATKMALWCYLIPSWNINNLKVAPGLTGAELDRGNRILAAAKDIYKRGTTYNYMLTPKMTATPDHSVAYPVSVDGKANHTFRKKKRHRPFA